MTNIYSPQPLVPEDPYKCREIFRAFDCNRAKYPALPWKMEHLIGSVWRNLYTRHQLKIEVVGLMFPGSLEPFLAPQGPQEPLTGRRDHIGIFVPGLEGEARYCVDHWIRFDTLNPEQQLNWYVYQVKKDYEWFKRWEAHDPSDWNRERAADDWYQSVKDLHTFSREHRLPLSGEMQDMRWRALAVSTSRRKHTAAPVVPDGQMPLF